ncbi:MAG TPA: cytochrome d ubiquinol oxidase subunit II [Candidatus Melainabacteria bacterium]|jgi:cytochrome bd ubiquinol oxidase subunit II|nr:cytochrome d ubiquinol oxidase subunit II [Candidatus Melainabacteria bacterium]HIN64870.1 cytochrome d ubiquinol oxidase subunit II [Candidatus Obscuribacterales bacterium]
MIDAALYLAIIMLISLNIYALLGGADYGGGVWDLFAVGKRAKEQRELIAGAIGPIWEANHVWLILVVVILFSAFPAAFSLLSISLHVPLTLLLLGIIARGTAFTFRKYDSHKDHVQRRWGRIFAMASLITPVLLGIVVGAISQGKVSADIAGKTFSQVYIDPWCTPFCFAVGGFALVLFSFLAAVYSTVYAPTEELKTDFQRRALGAQVACAILALLVFILAEHSAPGLKDSLAHSSWSLLLQGATAACAISSSIALFKRKFHAARFFAAGQVTLILWGWGLAQYPYMIRPDMTINNAQGAASTQTLLLAAIASGALLLFPSFYFLLKVFKHKIDQPINK